MLRVSLYCIGLLVSSFLSSNILTMMDATGRQTEISTETNYFKIFDRLFKMRHGFRFEFYYLR